jgi:hypothetical protein
MDDQDFATLADLVERYDIDVVISALRQVVEVQADEMLELGLNDKAKLMSLVAWNLRMFGNAPREDDVEAEEDMQLSDGNVCLSCGFGEQYEEGFCESCFYLATNENNEADEE